MMSSTVRLPDTHRLLREGVAGLLASDSDENRLTLVLSKEGSPERAETYRIDLSRPKQHAWFRKLLNWQRILDAVRTHRIICFDVSSGRYAPQESLEGVSTADREFHDSFTEFLSAARSSGMTAQPQPALGRFGSIRGAQRGKPNASYPQRQHPFSYNSR